MLYLTTLTPEHYKEKLDENSTCLVIAGYLISLGVLEGILKVADEKVQIRKKQ